MNSDGKVDAVRTDRLFRPNTGIYGIFGPLRLDAQQVYVMLKADVQN